MTLGYTTASDLVEATKELLLAGVGEPRNQLAANYTAGSGTMQFTYDTSNLAPGKFIEVGTNLLYVWSVNQTAKTATVEGGQRGTTDATATAGTDVVVAPRFPKFRVLQEINNDLADLCSPDNGLYQMAEAEFTFIPVQSGYDMAALSNVIDVYDVRYQIPGPSKQWPRIHKGMWRYDPEADTSDFPSGRALYLYRGGFPGLPFRVYYKAGFAPFAGLTDAITVSGLPTAAYDLPPLGAAIALMAGREVKRNFTETQGETRRSQEVPPGAVGNSVRNLMARRQSRINALRASLTTLHPQHKA